MVKMDFISKLTDVLENNDLPGNSAHLKMAPGNRTTVVKKNNLIDAAVMILLYPRDNKYYTVFIKRNIYDGPHSGQVSFPGGKKDNCDKDLFAAAVRETAEELGIPVTQLKIMGNLTPLHIPVSNFQVFPVVGYLPEEPVFEPDGTEVQYVIEAPLSLLTSNGIKGFTSLAVRGEKIDTPYYSIQGEIVWGATAMILSEFLEVLAKTG
jgi:8-oxo-dGTP pyrophosphatase MutT (NUDIX family)